MDLVNIFNSIIIIFEIIIYSTMKIINRHVFKANVLFENSHYGILEIWLWLND